MGQEWALPEGSLLGLLDAAPDAMVCVDEGGVIAYVNAQTERLFGYRREELLGQPVECLVPAGARTAHPGHRRRYLAEPQPRPMGAGMELAARRSDGTEFPAEISLSAIATADGVVVSAAIRDVTDRIDERAERERLRTQAERERLERQLHQSQRLESLGQLAGGVAHDFNNLLLVIRNYATFVREALAPDSSANDLAAAAADVDQIIAAADRASRLTHQLLAFGRREVVHPVTLSLNDVVAEMEQLLRRTLGEQIDLRTALASPLGSVRADPGQIEQVLVNLAVNARAAMPAGGVLRIETTNLDGHVRLVVRDDGVGMDPFVVERAFEPFFTTKPKGEGSGLGLATVYGIVTQAGGTAEITSEPGRGTTVTLLFPTVPDEVAAPEPQAPQTVRRGGATILVVEDEDAVRELTSRLLTRHGYTVVTASSGAAALDAIGAADADGIDLVLTDVVMPQMSGEQLVERLRTSHPAVATLFMSGYAEPFVGRDAPADVHVLEKPFTEETLLRHVTEALGDA